jgi:ribonuclease H2 subunit A
MNTDIIVGIDEAGRGPVLGSLIYAAAFWPAAMDAEISALGFDDSKVLTAADREGLFKKIRDHGSIGWVIEEISAPKISEVGAASAAADISYCLPDCASYYMLRRT